jgi:hypothetical protein
MKWRWGEKAAPEEVEREIEDDLRRLGAFTTPPPGATPPDAYWHNLIIRTNRKIDNASGAKAISLSWAARVAIPGVLAILSFLIGLRYYVPERQPEQHSLTDAVMLLPGSVLDSITVATPDSASTGDVGTHLLDISGEMASTYVIENTPSRELAEYLSDQEMGEVLAALSTRDL